MAHLNYANNSVVVLHDPFRSMFCLTTKRTITLNQTHVQLKRKAMQFVPECTCSSNRKGHAVRPEYAIVSSLSLTISIFGLTEHFYNLCECIKEKNGVVL